MQVLLFRNEVDVGRKNRIRVSVVGVVSAVVTEVVQERPESLLAHGRQKRLLLVVGQEALVKRIEAQAVPPIRLSPEWAHVALHLEAVEELLVMAVRNHTPLQIEFWGYARPEAQLRSRALGVPQRTSADTVSARSPR